MLETPRWSHSAAAVLLQFICSSNILHNFCFSTIAIRVGAPQDTGSGARKAWTPHGRVLLQKCWVLQLLLPWRDVVNCIFFHPLQQSVLPKTWVPTDLKPDSTAALQWTCLGVMKEETVLFRSGSVSVEISVSTSSSVRKKVSKENTLVHYPSWDIL